MASAPVAVAAAKLTIPNKDEHKNVRDELNGIYKELGRKIGELTRRRGQLETTIQGDITNIKLDDASQAFNAANTDVQAFNQQCQDAQTAINANNQALRELLARIQTAIAQAKATKAAADAAAAEAAAQTAAEEAAALQTAKDSLQEYIESLRIQLQGINENTLNDFNNQVNNHHNNINQLSSDVYNALDSAVQSNSPETIKMLTEFDTDVNNFIDKKSPEHLNLKQEFNDKKDKIVKDLDAKIKALKAVADDANVTAQTITNALDADKKNPIDDKNLGEIKERAAELAAEFGAKATEFANKKAEIERKIEEDKRLFQEKQKLIEEYQRIMSILDSQEIKDKESAIQENIKNAQEAEKAALDTNLSSLNDKKNMNLRFQLANTNLNTSISSLKDKLAEKLAEKLKPLNIHNLEVKLQELQDKFVKIQQPPIDVAEIQTHIDALTAAKTDYERLLAAQEARAAELSAARSISPSLVSSPVSSPGSPPKSRTEAAQRTGVPKTSLASDSDSDSEQEQGPDSHSTSLMDQLKRPRSRPLFQGASALVKRRYVYIPPSFNADDPIYLIDLPEGDSGGGGGSAAGTPDKGGGKIIQHGGQPPQSLPTGAVIYELNPTYEDNILLLASLKSAKVVLNDDKLIQQLEKKATKKISDTSEVSDTYTRIQNQLISSEDTGNLTIARRAVYKSSIMKLMAILDSKIPREQGLLSYTDMYSRLWTFMNPNDAVGIIKELKRKGVMENDFAFINISEIVGWTERTTTNPNLDTYFDVFINCGKSKSNFLTEVTQRVNKNGILFPLPKQVAYRFKLNWIILIAFYCHQTYPLKITYANVGELIENTYNIFLGWMKKNNDTYDGMFLHTRNPTLESAKIQYSKGIDVNIKANITGDVSIRIINNSLITKITEKLCEGQMTNDAKIHENEPDEESLKVGPPSGKPLDEKAVFEKVSNIATTTSPSPRQAWMNSSSNQPVSVPIGPKTLPSPPSVPSPLGESNPLVFGRVVKDSSPKSNSPVPALQLGKLQQKPPKIQSVRTSQELFSDLQRQLSQSARISLRPGNVNLNNPAIQQSGTSFPGRFGIKPEKPEGTGDLSFLEAKGKSEAKDKYLVLQPRPPEPDTKGAFIRKSPLNKRTAKQYKQTGGHKRTRKHRTPTSSTPAPATRRHRDQSSSTHKRTRRRREH
jgi:hypothetical protein